MEASVRPVSLVAGDRLDRWARQVALQLLWAVPALMLLAVYVVRVFHGLYLSEAMDVAQVARHISRGEGFVTSFLRPVALLRDAAAQPEVMNPPLFALVLAVVFGALPAKDSTVVAVSCAFHALAVIAVFALGRRLFDWRAGALGALMYAVSAHALTNAIAGTGMSLAAVLCCLSLYALLGEAPGVKKALWAGVLGGLCCMTNYAGLLLLPVLAALAYHRARSRAAAAAVGAFAVVCAPWLVRNYLVTGDPFFSLQRYLPAMFMTTNPGYTLFRSPKPGELDLVHFIAEHPTEVVKKAVLGTQRVLQSAPAFLGLGIAALVIVGLFVPFQAGISNSFRRCAYWLLGLLAGWGAVSTMTPDVLALAAPVAAALAAGLLIHLTARQPGLSRAGAVLALLALQGFPALVGAAWPAHTRNPSRDGLQYLNKTMPADGIIVTDVPWSVAWYADRPAIWLPVTEKDLAAVDKRRRVNAIFLSWLVQTYTRNEQALWWQEMYVAAKPPRGFEVEGVFPPGDILFTRREVERR